MKLPYDLVVVDVETNGLLEAPEVRITEIGAAVLKTDGTLGPLMNQLIDGRPVGPKSNVITDAMLEGQPLFGEFAPKFPRWCWDHSKNFVFAAWNTNLILSTLRWEYHRTNTRFPFPSKGLCARSVALAHFWRSNVFVASCGIDKALRMLGLSFEGTPYRAGDDAYNVARILQKIFGFAP